MNGIVIVNKPKGITSRDVVNKVCKIYNTKKVGHTGTLDPIASGVLVVCIGSATKLVDLLVSNDKEYIATVKLGILTDTLDLDGKIIMKKECAINKEKLIDVLNSFVGTYEQMVPIYSAVKINGKKLYDYARKNINVELPKRKVEIKEIDLLDVGDDFYKFKVCVSKGTYIRSLIKDINEKLKIIGVMSNLVRIRQGIFTLDNAYSLLQINENKEKLLSIGEVLNDYKKIEIDEKMYVKIKNGQIINNIYNRDKVVYIYKNNVIAIYQIYDKDDTKMKPYKMFL